MKVETKRLQRMAAIASKCVGNDKMLPLTSMMEIYADPETETMSLKTTTGTEYLVVSDDYDGDEKINVVVMANKFLSLVKNTTSKMIEMVLTDKCLVVKGNGTYKIEIPVDSGGKEIHFPQPYLKEEWEHVSDLSYEDIVRIHSTSFALSTDKNKHVEYMCYNCGSDYVMATDSCDIAVVKTPHSDVEARFLVPSVMFKLFVGDFKFVNFSGSKTGAVRFCAVDESLMVTVYSKGNGNVEDYKSQFILDKFFAHGMYANNATISAKEAIESIKRVSFFIDKYDVGLVKVRFGDEDDTSINDVFFISRDESAIDSVSCENYGFVHGTEVNVSGDSLYGCLSSVLKIDDAVVLSADIRQPCIGISSKDDIIRCVVSRMSTVE